MIPGLKEGYEEKVKAGIIEYIDTERRKEAALEIAYKYTLLPGKEEPEV